MDGGIKIATKLYYGNTTIPKSSKVTITADGLGAWVGTKGFGYLFISHEYMDGGTKD